MHRRKEFVSQFAGFHVTFPWVDRQRLFQHTVHRFRHTGAPAPRCGARLRIGRRDKKLNRIHTLEGRSSREQFDENQRKGKNIGPGAGCAAGRVELLRCAVLRRKRLDGSTGFFKGSCQRDRMGENFRNAEIEHLQHRAAAHAGKKKVCWFNISVSHAFIVGDCEGIQRGRDEIEGFSDRERSLTAGAPGLEFVLE
jgi:hypothetical protein